MIAAGWKLVPIDPTDDMLVSGQEAWVHRARTAVEDCEEARVVYAAMVDTAPSPTTPAEPIDEKHECVAAFARTYPWEGEEVAKLAGAKVAVWRDSTIRALDRHAVFKQGWLARASLAHADRHDAAVPAADAQGELVRSALAELVALKDLKDEELRMRQRKEVAIRRAPDELARVNAMRDDYNRRKSLAWDSARAALGQAASTKD